MYLCRYLTLVFSFLAVHSFGQNYQREINDQVWKPFIQAFNNHDANAFLKVHSKDLIRSGRDQKTLLNWDAYLKQQSAGNKFEVENKVKRSIDLHFTERLSNQTQAIDVGIYKTTVTRSDGSTESFYGRFHVVHRKENGVWRILVDTDSSEGNTIGEKDFLAAKPL